MLFNSITFWFFFIGVFSVYWLVPYKYQNKILLLSSYIFYGAWDWRFLSLIIISTIVDYTIAKKIAHNPNRKKFFLTLSIISNFGILGIFKYLGFFIEQFNVLFSTIGLEALLPTITIILPVGISFYTFQTMSYTIDVFRNETKPIHSLLDFALYVSFFPQLVAGPIERSHRLLPQIIQPRKFKNVNIEEGFYYIIYGLFLKIVLADNMAVIANAIYSNSTSTVLGADVIVGTYAFAFQIYGDFAGYSSIAIGLGKWLGIDLMTNFKVPYIAQNPSEFWQRWHISLSTWLRDYLYIPLGGNRRGKVMTYRNLLVTMILGGLWHGAGWSFIVWGTFHGLILIFYREMKASIGLSLGVGLKTVSKIIRIVVLFHLVCISWVFFRAETVNQAWEMLSQVLLQFSYSDQTLGMMGIILFFALPIFMYEVWDEKRKFESFEDRSTISLALFFNFCFFMILIFPAPTHREFIYFQF